MAASPSGPQSICPSSATRKSKPRPGASQYCRNIEEVKAWKRRSMPFSSSRAARLLLHMQHHQAAAFVLAAALIFWLPAPARAELSWRGPDLAAKGIHKGAGLPLFSLYIDGAHSSFATQELNKDTPPWTLFTGSYNQFYYTDSLRDERGNEVPGRFHLGTYLSVMRVILLTPLRTERVHHFVEVVPTFVATDFAVGGVSARTAGFGDLALGTGLTFPEIYNSEALKIEALVDFDLFLPCSASSSSSHPLLFHTARRRTSWSRSAEVRRGP
jgi:hypothetical protein